jgi:hypothetical protein
VAGAAETATKDPRCAPPQVLEIEAVVYGPRGEVQQILPTFPGDDLAAAVGINDNGDVVGLSGGCLSLMNKISPQRLCRFAKARRDGPANRRRFGREDQPARNYPRVAPATPAPWAPDGAAMISERSRQPAQVSVCFQ